LGDRVTWESGGPDCKVNLPRIRIWEGRRDDWLYDQQNNLVSPLAFQFESYPDLIAWKLYQRKDGTVVLYVAWRRTLSPELSEKLAQEVRKVIRGRKVEVTTEMQACPETGKFKRVICRYRPHRR
jgi:hypothetical protein